MNTSKHKEKLTNYLKQEALKMALLCVRNTYIEDLHAGITPTTKTGDYSDVYVHTPDGIIPWNELSRISDKEMKIFNKEVVNKLYTYLEFLLNPSFEYIDKKEKFTKATEFLFPHNWDEPELNNDFIGKTD